MQVPSPLEGGDDRPTFFELVAADKLVPSLRAALVYSVGVLVTRRPSLARLLDHEDEAFALFMALVEWHSFATSDGSMAEGLYGLQRSRRTSATTSSRHTPEPSGKKPRTRRGSRHITKAQKISSVVTLFGVPYARAKLDKLYEKLATARGLEHTSGEASIAGAILGGVGGTQSEDNENDPDARRANAQRETLSTFQSGDAIAEMRSAHATRHGLLNALVRRGGGLRGCVTSAALRNTLEDLFVTVYPYAHSVWEAATLACWVKFLLGGGETHDPVLHLLGLKVTRASISEAMQRRVEVETRRQARIQRIQSVRSARRDFGVPFPFSLLVPAILVRNIGPPTLRLQNFVTDYAQGGLMAAVVGFKLMEWWYGTAEEKVFRGSNLLPVPDPPPVPKAHPDGVKVAKETGQCPICKSSPANKPAAPACSGYVFCFECLQKHVLKYKTCPVTLLSARVEDIRKLFSE